MQFVQPVVGAISDRMRPWGVLGRRRPFLVLGQATSCIGCFLMMISTVDDPG